MIYLSHLSFAGLADIVAALTLPGLSDLILWTGTCAIAGMLFLVLVIVRRAGRAGQITPKWVVVDGSNVMYWKGDTPQIDTVREVLARLSANGFTPGIMFDANAGYLLTGRYEHDGAFEKLLGLPRDHVMVVHKGTPADISILAAARDLGARIVTNDRFREWAETHPEVHNPGYLIRGEYRAGKLWLDLSKGG